MKLWIYALVCKVEFGRLALYTVVLAQRPPLPPECEEIQPEKSSKKELRDRGSRTKDYVFLYFGFGRVPEESFSTYRRQFYLGFGRVVLGVRMQTGIFINEGGFFLVEELFIFDKLGLAKRRKSVSPRWNFINIW